MSYVLCLCAAVLFFVLSVCFLVLTLYWSYRSRAWSGVLAALGLFVLFPASLGVFLLGTLLLSSAGHFFSDTELKLLYGILCSANLILPGVMAAKGFGSGPPPGQAPFRGRGPAPRAPIFGRAGR